jgi:hypothetical protein
MLPGEYLLRTLFGKEPGGQRLVLADRLQIVDDPKASIGDGPELRLGFLYLSDVHDNLQSLQSHHHCSAFALAIWPKDCLALFSGNSTP